MNNVVGPGPIIQEGCVPFVCEHWEGKPLFIIQGGVRYGICSEVIGKAYRYEDYPWPEGKKVSKEECRRLADENNKKHPRVGVSEEVYAQFERILKQ